MIFQGNGRRSQVVGTRAVRRYRRLLKFAKDMEWNCTCCATNSGVGGPWCSRVHSLVSVQFDRAGKERADES